MEAGLRTSSRLYELFHSAIEEGELVKQVGRDVLMEVESQLFVRSEGWIVYLTGREELVVCFEMKQAWQVHLGLRSERQVDLAALDLMLGRIVGRERMADGYN